MTPSSDPRLVMLGPAVQVHSDIANVVEVYRAAGVFKRWPVDYLATHGEAGVRREARLLIEALRRFIVLLFRERMLVVHVHAAAGRGFWREALFMALALAARCPLVIHLHGAGFDRLYDGAGPLGRRALRALFERAFAVVVSTDSLANWVGSIARSARVEHLPHPVPQPSQDAEGHRPNLVVFMAPLDAAHGIYDVVEALARVRAAVPDVRLVCAGEGERESVAQHAERLGVLDAVRFTGWVGPSGKRALFETAAVLAAPSHREGLRASVLEAMASGVPVVVSPLGAAQEAVAHGVTGFHVAAGDVASLERLLRKLLLDRALGARIGAAARESVRLRCAPERVVARLETLYATLGLHAIAAQRPLGPVDVNPAA